MSQRSRNQFNCKALYHQFPDLLADPLLAATPAIKAHLDSCAACQHEYAAFERTSSLLDLWAAPGPSPYFDQKLAVLLREEQSRPQLGWLGRLRERLLLNTGPQFRPAIAGTLALMLMVGGGGLLHVVSLNRASGIQTSATVNDLQILDKNSQTIQQMDQLLEEDGTSQAGTPTQPAS